MKTNTANNSKLTMVAGMALALMAITGVVHLIDASDAFGEAAYKGLLFIANGVGAAVAAYGIWNHKRWGWLLGLLIALGSVLAYITSRTIGMPQIPAEPDEWLEPLGVISMLAESGFLVMGIWVLDIEFRPKAQPA